MSFRVAGALTTRVLVAGLLGLAATVRAGSPTSAPAPTTSPAAVGARVTGLLSRLEPIDSHYGIEILGAIRSADIRSQGTPPDRRAPFLALQKAQRAWYAFVMDVQSGKRRLSDPATKERARQAALALAEAEETVEATYKEATPSPYDEQLQRIKQQAADAKGALKEALQEQVRLMEELQGMARQARANPIFDAVNADRMDQVQRALSRLARKAAVLMDTESLEASMARGGAADRIDAIKGRIRTNEQLVRAYDELVAAEERVAQLQRQRNSQ